jgi:hypothetical protein
VTKHDERSELLANIAILSGFHVDRVRGLPDGRKPDVLRFYPGSGAVFFGEAKDTERPNNKNTINRLSGYMEWFKLISSYQLGSIFAICFGEENDAPGWAETIRFVASKVGLDDYELSFTAFGCNDFMIALLPRKDRA